MPVPASWRDPRKELFGLAPRAIESERTGDGHPRGRLAQSLETAALDENGFHDVGSGPGSSEGASIDWLTTADAEQAIVDDVRRIRHHPLVPGTIPVHGFTYDVRTDRLVEIAGAAEAGAIR